MTIRLVLTETAARALVFALTNAIEGEPDPDYAAALSSTKRKVAEAYNKAAKA